MDVVDSILNFTSNLSVWFGNLIQTIQSIGTSVIQVFSYIWSILKALWLGLTSLISPLGDLIDNVLSNGALSSLFEVIDNISVYIGGPATLFIVTLFLLILVRIVVAFVFKIFRLNIDYNTLQNKTRTMNQHSKLK